MVTNSDQRGVLLEDTQAKSGDTAPLDGTQSSYKKFSKSLTRCIEGIAANRRIPDCVIDSIRYTEGVCENFRPGGLVFQFFKMPGNDTEINAEPTSPLQSPPVSAAQPDYSSISTLLDSLTSLSKINSVSVVQHGARVAVVGELLVSVLTHLPPTMRADIVKSFRDRIEEVMSLSDDRGLPQQYHSALLSEINLYLNALQ